MSMNKSTMSNAADTKTGADVSVVEIINMMLTFWWFIIIFAILVGGTTYTYFKVSSVPQYKSTAKVYVNTEAKQTSTDVNANALTGAANLLPTYIDVLQSKQFLGQVSDDLDNRYSITDIQSMLTLEGIVDTNIISISVKHEDAHVAYLVCSSVVNNAPAEVSRVFGGGSTKLTEYPEEAKKPEDMHTTRNSVIGLLVGAAIAMLVIFLVNLFDTRVKSKDELMAKYDLPIIGEIPGIDFE